MFIAMNRFRVKKGSEEAFEKVWLSRDTQLTKVPGVSLRFAQPFFKEFTLTLPKSPASIVAKLAKKRILPGVPIKGYDKTLADCLLVAVTEQRTREEIDAYAAALAEVLA